MDIVPLLILSLNKINSKIILLKSISFIKSIYIYIYIYITLSITTYSKQINYYYYYYYYY